MAFTSLPFCVSDSFCISLVPQLSPFPPFAHLSLLLAIGRSSLYYPTNSQHIFTQCTNIFQQPCLARNMGNCWVDRQVGKGNKLLHSNSTEPRSLVSQPSWARAWMVPGLPPIKAFPPWTGNSDVSIISYMFMG